MKKLGPKKQVQIIEKSERLRSTVFVLIHQPRQMEEIHKPNINNFKTSNE